MSDLCKINVSLLNSYEKDFESEMKNFNNKTYTTFLSSYLNNCSDSYVNKMKGQLEDIYNKIKKGYSNINNWWDDYNSNIESLENYLSDSGGLGAISESSIRNSANNLPNLKKYNLDYAGIIPASISSISYSTVFVNNVTSKNVANRMDNVLESTGASKGDNSSSLLEKFANWITDEETWENSKLLPFLYKAGRTVWDILKSVGATIATAFYSLIEGLFQFVEAIFDFVMLAGAAIATVNYTLWIDIIGKGISSYLGKEYKSLTGILWDETKSFVATKYVSGWFDSFYQNDDFGKNVAENAVGFDTVRSVGSGVGYVAGIVVLTIVTAGAGAAGVAAGSASGTAGAAAAGAGTAASISATQMAATAAVAGTGRGTQNAWADGAGTAEGLAIGTLTGLWEGLQFYVAGKISALNVSETKIGSKVLESVGSSKIKTNLLNSFSRVILDSADGGVEGLVIPAINSLYKDGFYDDNGNYVEFLESQSFLERYSENFDDNGGWSAVLTQAVIGAFSSLIGEVSLAKSTNVAYSKKKITEFVEKYDMPETYVLQILENKGVINSSDASLASLQKQYQELLNKDPNIVLKTLEDSEYKLTDNKSLKNSGVAKIADEAGYISKDVANKLRKIFFADDNVIGIHRTGLFDAQKIMEDGLSLTGHEGVKVDYSNIDLSRNVSFFEKTEKGFANFILSLKTASDYKTYGKRKADALIINIPKTALDADIIKNMDIVDTSKVTAKLKTEFINGYITSNHGNVINYYPNSINKKTDILSEFKNLMQRDDKSNPQMVNFMYNIFEDLVKNGKADAIDILKSFNRQKQKNPNIHIASSANILSSAYWSKNSSELYMAKSFVSNSDSGTLCHELGHCLFDNILNGKLPDNWEQICARARTTSMESRLFDNISTTLQDIKQYAHKKAEYDFEQNLIKDFGLNFKDYEKVLTTQYSDILNNLSTKEIELKLKTLGYKDDVINAVLNKNVSASDLANVELNNSIVALRDEIYRREYGDFTAISDMIDNVYSGTKKSLPYMHGANYYKKSSTMAFHELIANFTQLKLTGDETSLSFVKSFFGDELYTCLENTFSKLKG